MKRNFKQRYIEFFTKERKVAIADIFEKIGTALLIGVILGSIISDKGTFLEIVIIASIALLLLVSSVYLRTD